MVAIVFRSGAGGRRCLPIALSLLALALPATARAGVYNVYGCDWTGRIDGWVATATPGYGTAYNAGCPGGSSTGGLVARSVGAANQSLAPGGSYAAWAFYAPAGTRIVGFSGLYGMRAQYPWEAGVRNSQGWTYCGIGCPALCPSSCDPWYYNWSPFALSGFSDHVVSAVTMCMESNGCRRDGPNSGEAHLTNTVVALADDYAPGVAITGGSLTGGGWLRGVQSLAYSATDNAGIRTIRTLIDGQSVGRDDRPCDAHAVIPCGNASGTMNLDTALLFRPDGVHRVTIEATDGGYNVASASRQVLIDNTAPAQPGGLAITGAGTWQSTNRFSASWTLPSNAGSPIAGVAYELCPVAAGQPCGSGRRTGRELQSIDDLEVPGDGRWMLRLWLRDEAGNEDRNRSVTAGPLLLDRTPPNVTLEPRTPDDPTRVYVDAADAVSGIADVAVEIHRRGSAAWHELAVARSGQRYTAVIDDETLAAGTYDIRARAVDAAGNERSTSGSPTSIKLPARIRTALRAGQPVGHGRRHRLDATVNARLGAPVVLHGRLTAPGDNPLPGANIEVWQHVVLPGVEFKRVGTARTGRDGRFRFRIPPGPSSVVRFRYPGTALQLGATRDVEVGVRAATSLRVTPRDAVNGEYVTFRGRLLGRPIPSGGKLVELQVYTRRRWRTFAQPRASAKTGRWRFEYRFEAIRGVATFRFRARVRREALYPYELGLSRSVRVRVRGL